ncbi:hypothetical protein POM88_039521 [Heracleum sosnowskyi]|uniref:Uncharacterized protein n=1 Tax=Heracleum sosnowskyi TaxID=360622 RepID=A0AAD8M6H1_9APIA|nr:hypothetical protein POM88_039521 [Heracleum sosnowskyi]
MISAFFLLSLFTILGSQARMLPAGEHGIFETISNSLNYKKENKWISMVADQITAGSFMISNYRKKQPRSPPPPRSATPKQPGINDYSKKPRPPPPSPLKSGSIIISSILKRPTPPPPPAPGASPPKTGINDFQKIPKSPPSPPYVTPTSHSLIH